MTGERTLLWGLGAIVALRLAGLVVEKEWWMRLLGVLVVGSLVVLALAVLTRADDLRELLAPPRRTLLIRYAALMLGCLLATVLVTVWWGRLMTSTVMALLTVLVVRELSAARDHPATAVPDTEVK